MGEMTKTVIEYLTTDKDCTLHSTEVGLDVIFSIKNAHGIHKIINGKGKNLLTYPRVQGEQTHFIEYHN